MDRSETILSKVISDAFALQKQEKHLINNNALTLFTFSTLQLCAQSIGHVVGGVALQAAAGARAELAVVGARLAALLLGVVEGHGTGVQTPALIQVTLHSELIWTRNRISQCKINKKKK